MSDIVKRLIKGAPYLFEKNEWGWRVAATGRKTDRFHRNYQILVTATGFPVSCSCPVCHHTGAWCKHLQEVELIYRELHPEYAEQLRQEAVRCGFLEGGVE